MNLTPSCPLCTHTGGRLLQQTALARLIEPTQGASVGTQRLILQRHCTEFSDLQPDERQGLMDWLAQAEHELRCRLQPDKVNLASLGNYVPHLHWHLIPRWVTDPLWPDSPWSAPQSVQVTPLPSKDQAELRLGSWAQLEALAQPVRQAVFVEEQSVPAEEEWDWKDAIARHAVILREGVPLATGRLVSCGGGSGLARIGRMAVLRESRASGLGREILGSLCQEAIRLGLKGLILHAQTHALGFYEQMGFVVEGGVFDECGIPHRLMRRQLDAG